MQWQVLSNGGSITYWGAQTEKMLQLVQQKLITGTTSTPCKTDMLPWFLVSSQCMMKHERKQKPGRSKDGCNYWDHKDILAQNFVPPRDRWVHRNHHSRYLVRNPLGIQQHISAILGQSVRSCTLACLFITRCFLCWKNNHSVKYRVFGSLPLQAPPPPPPLPDKRPAETI